MQLFARYGVFKGKDTGCRMNRWFWQCCLMCVLCMYGSSLWVYTRPRAGLNSIGLRGVLAFEVCPATSRSNCHSHQVSNFFSFIFKYFQMLPYSNFVRGQFSFCKCGPRESRLGCQQKNVISVKVCKYLQAPSGLDPSLNDG